MDYLKKNCGFIQIPVLIFFLVSSIAVGATYYTLNNDTESSNLQANVSQIDMEEGVKEKVEEDAQKEKNQEVQKEEYITNINTAVEETVEKTEDKSAKATEELKRQQEELLKQQQELEEAKRLAEEEEEARRLVEQEATRKAQEEARIKAEQKAALQQAIKEECTDPINSLKYEILAIKEQYYKDVESAENALASSYTIQAHIERLTTEANQEINKLNNQISQIELECSIKYGI